MRKISVLIILAMASFVLTYCSASKKAAKAAANEAPKSTYAANLSTVIAGYCTPCHIPSKGGNKKAYDNFANVKTDIDEIIRRINLNPTDRGFMPFRKTEKLPADVITAFTQWKTDGMLEN
jgi:uncharacterized membrane protein